MILNRVQACLALAASLAMPALGNAQNPIRVGLSIAQTGPLSGAGKSGLLALQIWRDDVNAKGGLLGRPVELVVYDDQSNPSTTPGIYTKLVDVDKADLLIAPYGTNLTAPVMPLVKQRDLLLMGNFSLDANAQIKHDKYFNNAPWSSAKAMAQAYLALTGQLGVKTIAILAADAEFAQTIAGGVRQGLKERGLESVYDQNYPPNTVDFSSMLRALRAKKPEAVFVASYPSDSAAIIRALNETGVGSSVKIFGGAMVGLQYTTLMESLGSMLNGVVNFHAWVPERTMDFPGVRDFLARYQAKAKDANVDALGFYIPPFDYAIGQILAQAVNATKSLDNKVLAKYLRENEMKTIAGNFRYGPTGEWASPRVIFVQFQDVLDKNTDQFRSAGKQVIVGPAAYKTAPVRPFSEIRR
ncbi:MAG: branched-chain amino acid ABC transporter substrate-binding protein [Betaproteobacteria bacterium]|nr:branched-chain amino acid ABC transporter substrate-binding protein [Betaproteobacteria bacterium]